MFENRTYESLLREKLEKVDSGYDRREGSVIYDAMAPNSAESAQIYIYLDWVLNQMFGDTASREYLSRIARDTRGMEPDKATNAVLKGEFDCAVKAGSRFNLDELNYTVISVMDEAAHTYRLQCEMAGAEGNKHLGTLVPVDYVPGITKAELTEVLIPGEDEEETEAFRKRWRDSFQSLAFGGNKMDYKEKIKQIAGVGGVKVLRATNEAGERVGGHVKCVIIDSEFCCPSDDLIDLVQTRIDPIQNAGEGDGLAPIGHEVHIVGVQAVKIDVAADITYEEGYSFADIKSYIEKAFGDYLDELNHAWEESDCITVRISQIESRILDVAGVVDIKGTRLNGVEENAVLSMDGIAVRGDVHG